MVLVWVLLWEIAVRELHVSRFYGTVQIIPLPALALAIPVAILLGRARPLARCGRTFFFTLIGFALPFIYVVRTTNVTDILPRAELLLLPFIPAFMAGVVGVGIVVLVISSGPRMEGQQ